ncbi:TetR/AcrR family transcriptional regulator [Patulibacter sp. NPDC049589]|uniref:TetR/AcrR family transcriptional regulator n=1 Tax=Patulibacter sp. NPDC049589 TaxID=3154731 RepID=UPI0034413617
MSTTRMSAEERRSAIIEAAMGLVAQRGFDATPTLAIAKAAGISHAYLFRLFPSKEDLGVALVTHCNAVIHQRFVHAAEAAVARGEEPGPAMGTAYGELLQERDIILVQMHAHAASPTHPEIRAAMREAFRDLVELVRDTTGAAPDAINAFFAKGMLMNISVALDLFAVDEPWAHTLTGISGADDTDPACAVSPASSGLVADDLAVAGARSPD